MQETRQESAIVKKFSQASVIAILAAATIMATAENQKTLNSEACHLSNQ
jgi:xanthine/CO dehydrogenase XdhC/CoxF family maturation factor